MIMITVLLLTAASAFTVEVNIGPTHASTKISSLTSVTMDVCLAKHRFSFSDKDLLGLTSHLGGGDAILRIGGSDQNSFYYNFNSSKNTTYSERSGGKCCPQPGSCGGCAKDCTMPAAYWKSIIDFAKASGHKLMFGLVPEIDQAESLILYSAKKELPVFAYTFGNEIDR
jgi:hypothetical protein